MKKTLFIHAVPGKTGTSAIQRFLSSNDELLQKKGFHYIETLRWKKDGSNNPLVWILHHKHSKIYVNMDSISVVADQDRLLLNLSKEIANISEDFIIISSEIFMSLNSNAINELLGLFHDIPAKAIFYVRELRDLSLGFVAERIKFQES